MPTLIERLQAQGTGIPVAGMAENVAGQLGAAVELFRKLPESPQESAAGLLDGLGGVPVPQLQVAARIGSQIAKMASAMPADLSSLTAAFDPVLENLGKALGGDVIPTLRRFIEVAQAIDALTRFNINDYAEAPGASAGGSASGASGSGGGSGGSSGDGASGSGSAGGSGSGAGGGTGSGGTGSGSGAGTGGAGAGTASSPQAVAAARERRMQAVASSRQALSNLPSPLDAPGLVVFLERLLSGVPRGNIKVRKLPFFDDAQQLLETVVDIRHKNEADLKAHIATSLERLAAFLRNSFSGYLEAYGSELQALAAASGLPALQAEITALRAALTPIAAALEAGDLSGTSPSIAAAHAALDTLLPRLAALHAVHAPRLEALDRRTRQLSLDLERQMRQLVQMAAPANTFRFLAQAKEPLAQLLAQQDPSLLAQDMRAILEKPLKILDIIEASGVQQALEAPTSAINAVLQQMDAVMGQVAAAASGIFSGVDAVLAEADPQALLDEVHQAFENFRLALEAKARELFQPVSDAIESALSAVRDAVGGFDPASLIQSLKDFLEGVAGIFQEPAIKSALDTLQGGIKDATARIQAIHFSPVTDAVEGEIKTITQALQAVDPATLSTEIKLALTAAAALLPSDLDPVTGPMVEGFNALVDEGPKKWLGPLAAETAKVKAEVERFSPANLIGDALSAPFQSFIAQVEALQPLALLAPVEDALVGFRGRLLGALDPGKALQPLQQGYDGLLAQIDSLRPSTLMEPVNAAIHEATHKFREALPIDELADALTAVLDRIQHGLDLAGEVRQSLEQLAGLFNALEDSEQQLRTWLEPLLQRVNGFNDVSGLAAHAADIAAAVEACKAAGLAAAVEAAWGPWKRQLAALAPRESLEELIALRRRLRPDRLAVLSGPEKIGVEQLLARFEPLAPAFSNPMQALQDSLAAAQASGVEMAGTLLRWDARHHRPGGPVARLVLPDFTAAAFRGVLAQSLEDEFVKPVGQLFAFVFQATAGIRLPLLEVARFLQSFEDRAAALLTGSSALGGLRDGLLGLADRIEEVDLDFLARELDEVFNALKGKLDIVNPAHLALELKATLDTALGLLDLDLLLSEESKTAITDIHREVVEDLRGLDPRKILEQAVQPVYDEKVKPAILKVDITPLLEAMLAKLEELKGELETELGDVNDRYKEMLEAIPKMDAAEAIGAAVGAIGDAIGVDVGGSIGF